jgi:hypothetical protein
MPGLHLFRDKIAPQAAGTDLQGKGGSLYFGLYLFQIRFPSAAGTIFGMAHRVAGDGVLSADIAGP